MSRKKLLKTTAEPKTRIHPASLTFKDKLRYQKKPADLKAKSFLAKMKASTTTTTTSTTTSLAPLKHTTKKKTFAIMKQEQRAQATNKLEHRLNSMMDVMFQVLSQAAAQKQNSIN